MKPLAVFIGYDPEETAAYHVLAHSIMRHAKKPISITPLARWTLRDCYTRPRGPLESTDFALSRFLVPHLSAYGDYSIFMDCDMLVRCDLYDLLKIAKADELRAVWCVKHDYEPTGETKFLGQPQTRYPRKNWSSVMVFRNRFCEALTPAYVNGASGQDLHRFAWLSDDSIGSLPLEYNYLVGEEGQTTKEPKIIHFTRGTPCFQDYSDCEYSDEWFTEWQLMNYPVITEVRREEPAFTGTV